MINIAHQIVGSIRAHNFAVGHDFTSHAVEQALTKGAINVGSQYLDLLAALALTAGMIAVSLNAIRVGLLTRWMGVIGIFSGILILLPIGGATLEIVPAFWMLGMGILYLGRWPNGDPPAWAAGEARPWPTQAERRAEREDGVPEREARASRRSHPPRTSRRPPSRRRPRRAGAVASAAASRRPSSGPSAAVATSASHVMRPPHRILA